MYICHFYIKYLSFRALHICRVKKDSSIHKCPMHICYHRAYITGSIGCTAILNTWLQILIDGSHNTLHICKCYKNDHLNNVLANLFHIINVDYNKTTIKNNPYNSIHTIQIWRKISIKAIKKFITLLWQNLIDLLL